MEKLIKNRQLDLHSKNHELKAIALEYGIPITMIKMGDKFLPKLRSPKIQPLAIHLENYIKAPTITFADTVDHTARREFATCLQYKNKDLYIWLESNRLRYNHMFGLTYLPIIHEEILESTPNADLLLNQVIEIVPESAVLYDSLSVSEKVATADTIANGLKSVFGELKKFDLDLSRRNNKKLQQNKINFTYNY